MQGLKKPQMSQHTQHTAKLFTPFISSGFTLVYAPPESRYLSAIQLVRRIPSKTKRWPSGGLTSGQRRRRWFDVSPPLGQRLVFDVIKTHVNIVAVFYTTLTLMIHYFRQRTSSLKILGSITCCSGFLSSWVCSEIFKGLGCTVLHIALCTVIGRMI